MESDQRRKEKEQMSEYIDGELCKKCIYYDDFCCHNDRGICVNNCEYRDAEMVINAIINQINQEEGGTND